MTAAIGSQSSVRRAYRTHITLAEVIFDFGPVQLLLSKVVPVNARSTTENARRSKMAEFTSHVPGTVSWAELATTDQKSGVQFYRTLFGWGLNEQPMGPGDVYSMFT